MEPPIEGTDISVFFSGAKNCLTSLRPLKSQLFEAPSTGLDMRCNFQHIFRLSLNTEKLTEETTKGVKDDGNS